MMMMRTLNPPRWRSSRSPSLGVSRNASTWPFLLMDVSGGMQLTADTVDERDKFEADVKDLAQSINSMAKVSSLVNVWGVFVASNEVGDAVRL